VDLAAGVLDDDVTRGLERKRVSGRKNFTRQNYVDSPGRAISLAMGNKGPMPTQELTIGSVLSPSLTPRSFGLVWLISRTFSASEQYFSLTPN